jgi:hypothetical protein
LLFSARSAILFFPPNAGVILNFPAFFVIDTGNCAQNQAFYGVTAAGGKPSRRQTNPAESTRRKNQNASQSECGRYSAVFPEGFQRVFFRFAGFNVAVGTRLAFPAARGYSPAEKP